MKLLLTERGWRFVDFPLLPGLIALGGATFLGVAFITRVVRGAPLAECVAILLGMLVAAVVGAGMTQRSAFVFDRHERKVAWSRRGVFGWRSGVIPFSQIEFAVVQCRVWNGRLSHRVGLVTEHGLIPLTSGYRLGIDDQCRQLRATINKLLDVHLPSEDVNDIRQLVLSGQRLGAERLAAERYHLGWTKSHELVERLIGGIDPPAIDTQNSYGGNGNESMSKSL